MFPKNLWFLIKGVNFIVKVLKLFIWYKYKVFPTCADASFQNGPVERGH